MRSLGGAVICGAVLWGGWCVGGAQAQQIQVSGTNRTIAVTASDDAERRADTAVVHLGYMVYAQSSEAVSEDASRRSSAIADAVRKAGVAQDALESDAQSTGPVQDYQQNGLSPEERANRKFEAQQSWTVRTSAPDAAGVLAAAVSAGANRSGAIDWSVADEASLSAEAAGKALRHAREIANSMAAGLGAKLGPLLYASNEAQSLRVQPMMARNTVSGGLGGMGSAASMKLDLSAPMVRRSATVSAVFAIQ